MWTRWTTRCCSAVALTVAVCAPVPAQSVAPTPPPFPTPKPKSSKTRAADRTPFSLLPVRALWTIDLNNRVTQSPAYDATRGYFAIEQNRIVAYDLQGGARVWMVSAAPQMPLAAGGNLLFLVEPGMLTALRTSDGSIAWQLPFAETLVVPPVWDNGWLIAATATNEILAFRASDGELIWRRAIGSTAHAAPALAADRVYIPTTDGRVLALRVDTGEPIWERRLGGAAGEILPQRDRLYVGSTDNDFYCLLTRDGTIDWRWRTGADVLGVPVSDDRHVYFVALDNVLRALTLKSGGQEWKTLLPMRPTTGPVKAGDTLIVTGASPPLRAYSAKDGKTGGDIPASADLAAPPHLVQDGPGGLPVLIIVTQDIAAGSTVSAITRAVEPTVAPVAPLPGLIPMLATAPRPKL